MHNIHPLRQLLHKFGIDVHRHNSTPDKLSWLKKLDIKTVIDVGANTGQFAKEIRGCLPQAHIHSFEPIKECFQRLSETMESDLSFSSYNFALGETNSQTIINKSVYSPSSSLLPMLESHKQLFPHTKDSAPEQIKVQRLDDISELKADTLPKEILLKIDTQGYEDKVLKGASLFLNSVKIIIVETSFVPLYDHQPLFSDIYSLLMEKGFSYKGALHQKLDPKTGEIIFEDSFFLRA